MSLDVIGATVRFGGLTAIDDVHLRIEPAAVTGLIGPNGAGKTTLFNVITGLQQPQGGRIVLDGRDVTTTAPHRRARLGLSRTFQRLEVFGSMSVADNVAVAVERRRRRSRVLHAVPAEVDRILDLVGLRAVGSEPATGLPTGVARLVELGRALATGPRYLLLDECSSGLTEGETAVMGEALARVAAEGVGVLLVEHDVPFVMRMCSQVNVLDMGRLLAAGTPAEVQADRRVQEAYLGGGTARVRTARERRTRFGAGAPAAPARRDGRPPVLELRAVRAGYGTIDVLQGVDLAVGAGEVVALLGPNGAGKSTTLKVASGQLQPSAGRVRVLGHPVEGVAADRLARAGVCLVPEGRGVFPNLTVAENLRMITHLGLTGDEVTERSYTLFPRLAERRRQVAGTLSGGEQQMLALARALATDPVVLLIDELSMGLAPVVVEQLYDVVGRVVATERVSVVLVEQFTAHVLGIADRAAVMTNGSITATGRPDEIADQLTDLYLAAG